MEAIYDTVPGPFADRILLVMLPGALHKPRDLVHAGFVDAVRERQLPIDIAVADAHVGYYLDRNLVQHLHADIIAPAQARGYRRIRLMGISLGGMGALTHARAHPRAVENVVVLAPYLGVAGLINELVLAGGLAAWQPGTIGQQDDERRLLSWLATYASGKTALPRIELGYGTEDRYASASALLAACLPADQVVTTAGGHDWATWSALWALILDRYPRQ